MTRRKFTEDDDMSNDQLSPKQAKGVDLLATGRNVTETAAALEVTRQTVSGWLNRDSAFRRALAQRRREAWAESSDHLRSLVPKALQVVAEELDGEKPLAAAVHVLKACGLYGGLGEPEAPSRFDFLDL